MILMECTDLYINSLHLIIAAAICASKFICNLFTNICRAYEGILVVYFHD